MVMRHNTLIPRLFALGGILLMAGCAVGPTAANPYPAVPARQAETLPKPPVTATPLVWRSGDWAWNGGGYVWQPGEYVPNAGHSNEWMPAHWAPDGGGWTWVPGHWL
jgi:hypothetical protein